MVESKKMPKINDRRIYKNKYYPWYYNDKLRVNLVPISYYTRLQAIITLESQFGNKCQTDIKVIKGSKAIENGWKLGLNTYRMDGKRYQVKKYVIPAEYNYNRSTRRRFVNMLKKEIKKDPRPSNINKFLKRVYYKAYAIVNS